MLTTTTQNASAAVVLGKYAKVHDVITLDWLPLSNRGEFNLLKMT